MISLRERPGALPERALPPALARPDDVGDRRRDLVGDHPRSRLLVTGPRTRKVAIPAGAIGGILGGAVALRIRPNRPLVGAFAAWSLSALPALALLPPLPTVAVAVAYGVFQAGIAFGNNQFDTVLQREIPSDLLSRVDSLAWLAALGLSPVGQGLAGPAPEAFGTDAVLVTAEVLVVGSCAAGLTAPSVRAITRAAPAIPSGAADEAPAPAPLP